jgi:hypothetical protein
MQKQQQCLYRLVLDMARRRDRVGTPGATGGGGMKLSLALRGAL